MACRILVRQQDNRLSALEFGAFERLVWRRYPPIDDPFLQRQPKIDLSWTRDSEFSKFQHISKDAEHLGAANVTSDIPALVLPPPLMPLTDFKPTHMFRDSSFIPIAAVPSHEPHFQQEIYLVAPQSLGARSCRRQQPILREAAPSVPPRCAVVGSFRSHFLPTSSSPLYPPVPPGLHESERGRYPPSSFSLGPPTPPGFTATSRGRYLPLSAHFDTKKPRTGHEYPARPPGFTFSGRCRCLQSSYRPCQYIEKSDAPRIFAPRPISLPRTKVDAEILERKAAQAVDLE